MAFSPSTGPTAEAWEPHRMEIQRLYRQENKTVKQVQLAMENNHGFFAT
jgi:Clr5 domain